MTRFNPNREFEVLEVELRPICIAYMSNDLPPESSFQLTREFFNSHYKKWQDSETWILLKEYLTAIHPSIDNIVGFALGPLVDGDERLRTRSIIQHVAAKTMAEAMGDLCGRSINCYAQDPAYTDMDKRVLQSVGITPLNDPKGFLQVNKNTLVLSLNPNVPVKQIIADLQWPAAMLWNTVKPETSEKHEWRREMRGGEEVWVS